MFLTAPSDLPTHQRFSIKIIVLSLSFLLFGLLSCGTNTTDNEPKAEASQTEQTADQVSEIPAEQTLEAKAEAQSEPAPPEAMPEPTSDAQTPESTQETNCPPACKPEARQCKDGKVQRCTWSKGCLTWVPQPDCAITEKCEQGGCVQVTCKGPGECPKGTHCKDGKCQDNSKCCKEGAKQCTANAEKVCQKGPDGCGQWSNPKACAKGSNCNLNKCDVCRHRECKVGRCCFGTTCYNSPGSEYCLVQCDKNKGDLNNPDCQKDEFCIPITGGQHVCIPDGSGSKGDKCSIIKLCNLGLSCVNAGKGLRCYKDCSTSKGSTGNPACEKTDLCTRAATGVPGKDGVCVPQTGKTAKLFEICDKNTPCEKNYICTGEPGSNKTFCLAPCDPTKPKCDPDFSCVGYDSANPNKGICLQKCLNTGKKDICKYGLCRQKGSNKLCL